MSGTKEQEHPLGSRRLNTDGEPEIYAHKVADPNAKILVLHITTSFGKRYTCRTVDELKLYIDNIKTEKKLKRDEDVDIMLGFGRITQSEYAKIPACKYFIKPK